MKTLIIEYEEFKDDDDAKSLIEKNPIEHVLEGLFTYYTEATEKQRNACLEMIKKMHYLKVIDTNEYTNQVEKKKSILDDLRLDIPMIDKYHDEWSSLLS